MGKGKSKLGAWHGGVNSLNVVAGQECTTACPEVNIYILYYNNKKTKISRKKNNFQLTAAPMDSCVVPHRSTNRAALWLTAQIGRDAVLSESYGRRH